MTDKEDPLLQFFTFEHLRADLQDTSEKFTHLAKWIAYTLPNNEERHNAIRKLLEAKDCTVRSMLFKE